MRDSVGKILQRLCQRRRSRSNSWLWAQGSTSLIYHISNICVKLDRKSNSHVKRISISLSPQLLSEFNAAMRKAGFSDRSKAIQTALHSLVDQPRWQNSDMQMVLVRSIRYQTTISSIWTLRRLSGIISASTHIHLDGDNCLETIMHKGEIKKMKELANSLSKNREIRSIKVNFVSLV